MTRRYFSASSEGYSGSGGYVASFGKTDPAASLDEQRARFQQRSGRDSETHGEDDVGEGDWAVSYADMVTLLMAFFVILTSSSVQSLTPPTPKAQQGEKTAYEQQITSTPSILDGKGISIADIGMPANQDNVDSVYDDPEANGAVTDPSPSVEAYTAHTTPPEPDQLTSEDPPADNKLATELQKLVQQNNLAGQVEVLSTAQSVTLRISDKILFESGRALLETGGVALVQRLSAILAQTAKEGGMISVEGHTDPVPIRTAQFPSNWELSSARAAMVVRELVSLGLPANRLRAIGYAETQPVAENSSAEGRASNRRVELVITSEPKP